MLEFLILEEEGCALVCKGESGRGGSRDWLGIERLMMSDTGNGCNGTGGGAVAHGEPGVGRERDRCCEG
jgi:hypothetical protein